MPTDMPSGAGGRSAREALRAPVRDQRFSSLRKSLALVSPTTPSERLWSLAESLVVERIEASDKVSIA